MKALIFSVVEFLRMSFMVNFVAVVLIALVVARVVCGLLTALWKKFK